MKIDYMSRGLCVRLLLLLVIGLGLPILTVDVAQAQDEVKSTDGPGTVVAQAPADKQAAQTDTTAMAEGSAAGVILNSTLGNRSTRKCFGSTVRFSTDYVLKPAATAWDFVLPNPVQKGIHNVFDNLAVVRRVVNNALQLKFAGAARRPRDSPSIARLEL